MRKMSKAAKANAYDALARERDALSRVAHAVFNGVAPNAIETVIDDAGNDRSYVCTYEYRLYGALRADGGTLVQVFRAPNQPAQVQVHVFDDWLTMIEKCPYGIGVSTEIKCAADRLKTARAALCGHAKEANHG